MENEKWSVLHGDIIEKDCCDDMIEMEAKEK
jgi:hypothetical protein